MSASFGNLTTGAIGQFVNGATDDEWLTLIGQMVRVDDPGQVFLRRVLSA